MSTSTLREFLISIGYKVDPAQEKRFLESVEKSTKVVLALGAATVSSAALIVAGVEKITGRFEGLYYSSRRVGSSIGNIKAFGYAASQLGSSVEEAAGSLESFGRKLRENPGYYKFVESLGVATRKNGKLRDTTAILQDMGKVLAKKPYYQAIQFWEMLGIDENTARALMSGKFSDKFKELSAILSKVGLDPQKFGRDAVAIENALRKIFAVIDAIKDKVAALLAEDLKKWFEEFAGWLEAHSEEVAKGLSTIAKWVLEAAKGIATFIQSVGADPKVWDRFLDKIKYVADVIWKIGRGMGWLADQTARFLSFIGVGGAQAATPQNGRAGSSGASRGGLDGSTPHGEHLSDAPAVDLDDGAAAPPRASSTPRRKRPPGYHPGVSERFGDRKGGSVATVSAGGKIIRSHSDSPAHAGAVPMRDGTSVVTSRSGRKFIVSAEFAENFRGFIDDYEAAGGVIGPNSGGLGVRPGNASYHPIGRAIDLNQIGRNIRAGGKTLPESVENALAKKWGLRSGATFHSPDAGHFEVNNSEAAYTALKSLGRVPRDAKPPAPLPVERRTLKNYLFGSTPARPLGVTPGVSNDNSRKTTVTNSPTFNVHGAGDINATARALGIVADRSNGNLLRNLQGAVN